ncbi:MAG: CsgG/HfaB family protein [Planctomycetota bacterium]
MTMIVFVNPLWAQDGSPPPGPVQVESVEATPPIAVSVLPFVVPEGDSVQGEQIAEIISLLLSAESGFRVVDRQTLDSVLDEQALSITGLVETDEAIKIGRLVGARIIVVGRVLELGNSRMMTAKLVGTETTLIEGVVERGPLDTPSDQMLLDLSLQIVELLNTRGHTLVAQDDAVDPTQALIGELSGRHLPVFAVVVNEEAIARTGSAGSGTQAPDPAVETSIKSSLLAAGAKVKDIPVNDLSDWVSAGGWDDPQAWPRTLDGVDLVVTGKAFSEQGGQMSRLHVAGARAELNVISRSTGEIVLAKAQTSRGVDLSPALASKNALQAAGEQLTVELLRFLAEQAYEPKAEAQPANQE